MLMLTFTAMFLGTIMIFHYYFQWGRDPTIYSQTINSLFLVFSKVLITIGFVGALICWNTLVPSLSTSIANNRLIQLISNTSYSCYLFHVNFVKIWVYNQKNIPALSFYEVVVATLTDITFTLVISTVIVLVIEMPLMNLWRVYCENPLQALLKKSAANKS